MQRPVRTIGIRDLKARASEILHQVQQSGTEVVITHRGHPVARLEPIASARPSMSENGLANLRGALVSMPNLTWEDFRQLKEAWSPRSLGDV